MVMKTPGVYVVEKSAFPNSVVQVATAVPAFIGYTETAMAGNTSLKGKPTRLTSMSEFMGYFGGAPSPRFDLREAKDATVFPYADGADPAIAAQMPPAVFTIKGPRGLEDMELVETSRPYALFAAMRMFFLNGGGACYVTSIGNYTNDIDSEAMLAAIDGLKKEPEVTMVVIPETTRLNRQNSLTVQQAMMTHCGEVMKNRFSILDIHGGYMEQGPVNDPVACFRNDAGTKCLDYAAAYYPWLNSAVYTNRDFTFENINLASRNKLISLLKRSVNMDKALTPEIKKLGVAEVTGDFTIQVETGKTVVLGPKDIDAQDDSAEAGELNYVVVGAEGPEAVDDETAAGLKDKMCGQLMLANKVTYAFSQEDINGGKVSFKHDATLGAAGSFAVVVTDNEGVQTGEKTIAVVAGDKVIAKADVAKAAPLKITLSDDMDAGSVTFIGADPVDALELFKTDTDVLAKKKALSDAKAAEAPDADTISAAEDALAAAQTAAIDGATGKTLTVGGIGTWSTEKKVITFTPSKTFEGAVAEVQYMTAKGDVVSPINTIKVLVDEVAAAEEGDDEMAAAVDKTMRATVPMYMDVMNAMTKYMNTMPPAAAMAGIYTSVDNSRGVWKAPANVSVSAVASPMVNIDHDEQENLNVSTTGKSINAIRPFVGEGTLVWGARTLDGNSLDWRYINVRRTMIMIEESIKLASKAYVFEPNTAATWVTMKSMIKNFLTDQWKAGALQGAVPEDAFSVHVGLGDTMDANDILEGRLKIAVFLAVVRPAEFIEITFTQQLAKS